MDPTGREPQTGSQEVFMTNSNVLFCVCDHLDDSGIKHLHSVVLTAVRQSGIYFNCSDLFGVVYRS